MNFFGSKNKGAKPYSPSDEEVAKLAPGQQADSFAPSLAPSLNTQFPNEQAFLEHKQRRDQDASLVKSKEVREAEEKQKAQERVRSMMASPHANADMDKTDEDLHQEQVQALFADIENSVKRMQIKVGRRLQLDAMLRQCLEDRCQALQADAVEAIERVSDRKVMGQENHQTYGSQSRPVPFDFILDPAEFMVRKVTHVDEAVKFEKTVECMEGCRRPVDIVKRIMNSNVQELQKNLQNCLTSCREEYTVPGASAGDGEGAQSGADDKVFEKEIHACRITCMEGNKEIMKALEVEMGQTLPRFRAEMQEII